MTAAILLAMLAAPPVVVTVPRIAPPNIDGQLGDSAWSTAAALEGFTSPTSTAVPAKATAAWMGFDEHAVYLAFRCAEPQPDRLKATALAGSADVWQDDCVEVFLRSTGHPLEFEQFIVNSHGITQALRQRRQRETKPWQPQWRARAAVAGDCWTAELAIPFVALGRPAPRPGERLGLKLGREDYTRGEQVLSAWPAGSSYAGTEDYAEVFLERDNLLLNPDLRLTRDGRPADWVFSRDNADAQLVTPVDLGGRPAIKIAGPGRYLVMQQSQRLLPRRDYLLSMRVSGTAPLYFRTRCVLEPGHDSTRTDLQYRPAEQEVPLALRFTTGHDGQTLLIIGTVDGSAVGTSYLRELTLREADHREASGQAIPLPAGRLTEIRRLLLADCRLSRGFCGSPVDGTTNSYGWNAMRWEYGMGGAGAGVGYGWGNNEGVHLTLAEESAVAAVQIRGGVRGKLYGAGAAYDHPADAPLIHEFPGGTRRSRALLAHPVRTSRLSLFGLADGHLTDVQIFAVSQPAESSDEGQAFVAASTAGNLAPWVARKFGESERALAPPGPTLLLPGSRAVHLISEPQPSEVAWDALLLQSTATQGPARLPLTLTVHDPLNPRLELVVVDLELPAEGARLRLKFPTQVVPQGTRLWLTLRAEADAQLAAPALLRLVTRPRETHEPAALGYRTLLMRSFFTAASEARQWNTIRASTNVDDWAKTNQWGEQVLEVMRTIEQAGQIAPNDDLVRQYREWVHRNARPVELQAEL
ncbi:MAG: hypothetical protein HUU35_04230, partial [Armatimonadetes bacterium]|nr:hypothetical protein [Armatimonadota bacterium]